MGENESAITLMVAESSEIDCPFVGDGITDDRRCQSAYKTRGRFMQLVAEGRANHSISQEPGMSERTTPFGFLASRCVKSA